MPEMCFITAALLVFTGCDGVFGLDTIRIPADGPPAIDVVITDALTCWAPGQVGFDSDNDGFPDGCDNCPGDANVTQNDDDLDGVGDACDPHRMNPIDHLAFFDGFQEQDALWRPRGTNAQWTHASGAWRQSRSALDTNAQLVYGRMFRTPTVITTHRGQLHPGSLTFVGAYAWILNATGTPPDGLAGGTRSSSSRVTANVIEVMNGTGAVQAMSMDALPPQDPARVMVIADGTVIARRAGSVDASAKINTVQTAPLMTEIALHLYATSIEFTSVTVIETY